MKRLNKGYNNIAKKTISNLEDQLFVNVEKKIKNCSPEVR